MQQFRAPLHYLHKQCYRFAKLDKAFTESILAKQTKLESYYSKLLQFNKISERGMIDFTSQQFATIITLIKDEQDIKLAMDAYVNFIGHNRNLPQQLQDQFIERCLHYHELTFVLKVYYHQRTLMYFPCLRNTQLLIDSVLERSPEEATQLAKTLKQNLFIQVTPEIVTDFIVRAAALKNDEAIVQLYKLARVRKFLLSPPTFLQIAHSYYQRNQIEESYDNKRVPDLIATLEQGQSDEIYTQQERTLFMLASALSHGANKSYDMMIITLAKLINDKLHAIESLPNHTQILNELLVKIAQNISQDSSWADRLSDLLVKLEKYIDIPILRNKINIDIESIRAHMVKDEKSSQEVPQELSA